jgi:hypothetical protein
MTRFVHAIATLVTAASLSAQQPGSVVRDRPPVIWAPPKITLPENSPRPTVPKPMVTGLTVAGWRIELEQTELEQAQKHFGGTIGSSGDASEALGWLCLYGKDKDGLWGLWLLSGEIDGPSIGGIQWQRLPSGARIDPRCRSIEKGKVNLPIAVHLGMTRKEAEIVLGKPSMVKSDVAEYYHEHNLTLHNELYVADNDVYVFYRYGAVWSVQVNYTISS